MTTAAAKQQTTQGYILPSYYNGRHFRSRREARWARFYDALRIPFEYEPEGFHLDGLCYLPDFWLPEQECYVEVKGALATAEERKKARRLAEFTRRPVFIFDQPLIASRQDGPWLFSGATVYWGENSEDCYYYWCECRICGQLGIEFDGRAARLPCAGGHDELRGNERTITSISPASVMKYQERLVEDLRLTEVRTSRIDTA